MKHNGEYVVVARNCPELLGGVVQLMGERHGFDLLRLDDATGGVRVGVALTTSTSDAMTPFGPECVCGHTMKMHAPTCEVWDGCSCPEFIPSGTTVMAEPEATEPECRCTHGERWHLSDGQHRRCYWCACYRQMAEPEATKIPDAPTDGGEVQERGSVVTADRPPQSRELTDLEQRILKEIGEHYPARPEAPGTAGGIHLCFPNADYERYARADVATSLEALADAGLIAKAGTGRYQALA